MLTGSSVGASHDEPGRRGVGMVPVAAGYRLTLPLLVALLCGLLATLAAPARLAQAAPSVVQTIGTATGGGGQNSLTINVVTAVAAGSSIIVAVEVDSFEINGSN